MTDQEIIRLLETIKAAALVPYPWPPGAKPNDDRLVAALGTIAGIASKAIGQYDAPIERAPRK
jgi:hypothetical protein